MYSVPQCTDVSGIGDSSCSSNVGYRTEGFWKVLVTQSTSYLEIQLDLAEKAEFSKHGCQYSLRFNAIFKYVCMSELEVLQLSIFFWK